MKSIMKSTKKIVWIAAVLALALALTACASGKSAGTPEAAATQMAPEEAPIDLDLSALSGTVVYSQVYQMMTTPEEYTDAIVRVRGNFNYYQDPETKTEYFAVLIEDASACCAQGVEFVWAGEHVYPKDYPELGTEITVTGRFGTYEEDGYVYIQLSDAQVSWEP